MHDTRIQVGLDMSELPQPIELMEESFRILIVGDFGGRNKSSGSGPLRIDRDGIDAAMAIVAPELRIALDPDGDAEGVSFSCLDDLHPDRLLEIVPLLARLRVLRTELSRPGNDDSLQAPAVTPAAGGSLLDMILDTQEDARPVAAGDELSDVIRRAVRPHLAPTMSDAQVAMVAQVDDVIAASLRVLLHDPSFQRIEAAWRGVGFFLRRCDAGDDSQVAIADLDTRAVSDASVFRSLLTASDGSAQWSLILCIDAFGPDDLGVIQTLAATAAAAQTPIIVGAMPELAGASSFADGADVDDWNSSPIAGWDALRREPSARYISMALPRFLLRTPFGADSNSIEAMAFEEFPNSHVPHTHFLWGGAALLCGLIAAGETERGEPRPSHGTIDGIPLHIIREEGIATTTPCAEALMSQRTVMHLLGLGLTPLISQKDGDAVRVPRLQSIAVPPAPLCFGKVGGH